MGAVTRSLSYSLYLSLTFCLSLSPCLSLALLSVCVCACMGASLSKQLMSNDGLNTQQIGYGC